MTAFIEQDLVSYLGSKGVQVRKASGSEVVVHCFFCDEEKRAPKLYINADSWLFDCKLCGETGNRFKLLAHFGDKDEYAVEYLPGSDPNVRRQLFALAAKKAHELLLDNETVLLEMLERGLSPETIVEYQVGYVPPNLAFSRSLGEFTVSDLIGYGFLTEKGQEVFSDSIIIPYFSHRHVVQLRAKDRGGDCRYRTMGGDNVRLYNEDQLQGAERAIICEGEFDALITQQHLRAGDALARSVAVVAIPGAGALPDRVGGYFSTTKRVYLGLDPDDAGRSGTAKLTELLGTVARPLELPRGLPKCDWTELLREKSDKHLWGGHGWRDVMELLAAADAVGKRVFSVADAHLQWERDQVDRPGIKLGFPTLDARIKPGLRPGQIAIPLAKTGTGKSCFLVNVAHNTRSRRVLFLSLELTAVELFGMLRRVHFFWNPLSVITDMASDYPNLRIVDENRLREQDIATLIAEYTEDVGQPPELLVVDYLGYYSRAFHGDSYSRTSDAVMQLKAEAKKHDVAIIAPHQVNRGAKDGTPMEADAARDSGVVEETGDFVLSLYRPDQAIGSESMTGSFNMDLLKSRHGGKGSTFHLRFSNMSLVIVDAVDSRHATRVAQENEAAARGVDYEAYRKAAGTHQLSVVS